MLLFYHKYGRIILSSIKIYFNGYIFYCALPEKSKVGRIRMYVKKSILGNIRQDLQLSVLGEIKLENLWIEVVKNKTKYIVGAIYSHPNHDFGIFRELLKTSLRKISKTNKPCFIVAFVGDINIDFMKFHQHSGIRDYLHTLLVYNCLPILLLPTRLTKKS